MIERTDETRLLELLRGTAAERDEGLRELFTRTRDSLFALTLRMTGSADLADDAVQETFIDLMRAHASFRGDARLTTWLYRIAIRAATRVAARNRSRAQGLPAGLASSNDDPAVRGEQHDGAHRILRAIASLPPPQRAVIALSALEDLPQTEIAKILGLSSGTVYSRLHHARERLRQALSSARHEARP